MAERLVAADASPLIGLAQSQGDLSGYVLAGTIEQTIKLCILLHNRE